MRLSPLVRFPKRFAQIVCLLLSVTSFLYCQPIMAAAAGTGQLAPALPKPLPFLSIPPASFGLVPPPAPLAPQGESDWQDGDVFVASRFSGINVYSNTGVYKETIFDNVPETKGDTLSGMAFDRDGHLFVTTFGADKIIKHSKVHPHEILQTLNMALDGQGVPESIVFANNGDYFVGNIPVTGPGFGADIVRFSPGGVRLEALDVEIEVRGSDWMDLASDQKTLFYTSEGRRILRYDAAARRQLPDFSRIPAAGSGPGGDFTQLFALRLLPPGDGRGGLLVADRRDIKRLDGVGNVVQVYDLPAHNSWFALALDPNGTSFWAAGDAPGSNLYRFNIQSGQVEVGPVPCGVTGIGAIVVKGERMAGINRAPTTTCPEPVVNDNPVPGGTPVTLTATVSDPDCNRLTIEWNVDGGPAERVDTVATGEMPTTGTVSFTHLYKSGVHPVTITVKDGLAEAVCETSVTIRGNQPPTISCPPVVQECTSPTGTSATLLAHVEDPDGDPLVVTWEVGGLIVQTDSVPSGADVPFTRTYPIGSTQVIVRVSDGQADPVVCPTTVTIQDTHPPELTCTLAKASLWPPDHQKLIDVGLTLTVTDCDPSPTVTVKVYSDEPDEHQTGDGTTQADAVITPTGSGTFRVELRPERKGDSDGRVYLIVVTATDSSGNSSVCCSTVTVPLSQSKADLQSAATQAAAAHDACTANGSPTTPHLLATSTGIVGVAQAPLALPVITSVAISPEDPTLADGELLQLEATATLSDSSTQVVTGTATWTSSDPSVATVSPAGFVTAVSPGVSMVTALKDGVADTVTLTVVFARTLSIKVAPEYARLFQGATYAYTALGEASDDSTQNLTNEVTWSSSNPAAVSITTRGVATAETAGTATITATSAEGFTSSGTFVVLPRTLVEIKLDPLFDGPKIAGQKRQYLATGFFNDCSSEDVTNDVTWTSSNTAVATIDATGLATTNLAGTTTITATSGSVFESTELVVNPRLLKFISVRQTITTNNGRLVVGQTHQFQAFGIFNDGTEEDFTQTAVWASSKPAVATVSATGLVTAVDAGPTGIDFSGISASQGGETRSLTLIVIAKLLNGISILPNNPDLVVGTSRQLSAFAVYNDDSSIDVTNTATWSTTTPSTLSVNSTGKVTALALGSGGVTATYGGKAGTLTFFIRNARLASITVTPADSTMGTLQTRQFIATGHFDDGTIADLTEFVNWSTSDARLATIGSFGGDSGLLMAQDIVGEIEVRARAGTIVGTTRLSIFEVIPVKIDVTPAQACVQIGSLHSFVATAVFSDNSTSNVTSLAVWASSNTAAATIASPGVVTGVAQGTTSISATVQGISGVSTLRVLPPLASISVSPSPSSLPRGSTLQFSATGTFADSTTLDITAEVEWSSSNPSVATISPTGLATGVSLGQATITATCSGVSGSSLLTVTPPDPAPVIDVTSPGDLAQVKGLTPVVGSISDANLTGWSVKLIRQGESDGPILGSGSTPVANATLGMLDPTLLENDFYTVRVQASDASGQVVTVDLDVTIVGEQKVGIFTLTFTDLSLPLHGIPITVNRTYDTRLGDGRDFGLGWRLDVVAGNVKVRSNHDVMVTLPDNRRASFTFRPVGAFDDFNAQGEALGLCPLFSRDYTPNYVGEATVPGWKLRSTGSQELVGIPTETEICSGINGDVPAVTKFDLYYFDFTPYRPPGYVVSDQLGVEYEYTMAGGGRLVRVEEPNGNTLTITDSRIQHSMGEKIDIVRAGSGRIEKLVDPDGEEVVYEYPAGGGQLSASLDRESNRTRYLYNAQGKLREILDPRGVRAVRNEYSSEGRLISHTDAAGNRIDFAHDIPGRQEVVTDRRGNLTVYVYNEDGQVLAQTNALGHTRFFEYDDAGNRILEKDELGNETRYQFDAAGNVTKRIDPIGLFGAHTNYAYNSRGQLTQFSPPGPGGRTNEYDASGNLTATYNSFNVDRVTFEYDSLGRQTASTDPFGTRTESVYQDVGGGFGSEVVERRVVSSGNVVLRKSTFTYDQNGRQLTETVWKKDGGGIFQPYAITTTVYDANGRVMEVKDPLNRSSFTTYNAIGQQETTTDKNGNLTRYIYNLRGLLERVEYPSILVGGQAVIPTEEFGYDEEGNRTAVKDRDGHVTTTVFDKLNRPAKVIHPDGSFRETGFDPAGRAVSTTDERGSSFVYAFDAAGRKISQKDPLGIETLFGYEDTGQLLRTIELGFNPARFTTYTYNSRGQQTQVEFPDSNVRRTDYDGLGRRIEEEDESGIKTKFVYAATGELLEVQQPNPADAGQFTTVTRFEYDELGRKVKQFDALGRETEFAYNVRSELVGRTRPLGQSETFTYDFQGNLATRKDALNRTTDFQYNGLNLLTQKLFPDLSKHTFTYFAGGQRASFSIYPAGAGAPETTSFTLDGRGRLASQANPDGSSLEWTYDVAGNRTGVKVSRMGFTTQEIAYTWTSRNELFQVFRGGEEWCRYAYDPAGNRASASYANGTKQVLTYNNRNRLTKIENRRVPPGTTPENYLLDPALVSAWRMEFMGQDEENLNAMAPSGNTLPSFTGAGGGFVGFGINFASTSALSTPLPSAPRAFPASQGTLVTHYKPSTATITGNPAELLSTRQTGAMAVAGEFRRNLDNSLTFGEAGVHVTSMPVPSWDTTQHHALSFRWGPTGADIKRNGVTEATGPNPLVSSPVGRYVMGNLGTAPEIAGTSYGARGVLDEMALFARPLSDQELHDIATRGLTPVESQVFSSYTYTVNEAGLRTKVVEHTGRTVDYAYDTLRRLTQEKITEGASVTTTDYALDVVGNRLEKKVAKPGPVIETTTYTYNSNDELVTENGPDGLITYGYNANGETTSKSSSAGSVVYAWDFEGRLVGAATPSESLAFGYDVDGIRTAKSVNGTLTRFVLDKNRDYAQVLEERSISGSVEVAYIYGDDLISQERAGAGLSFYHYDGQLSTRQLTDGTATVTDNYTYDAFGMTLASSGATPNNYLYTGEQHDRDLGCYYLRARYLRPENGRFTSGDPVPGVEDDPLTFHRYVYASNNPVSLVDPNGLTAIALELLGSSAGRSVLSQWLSLATLRVLGYALLQAAWLTVLLAITYQVILAASSGAIALAAAIEVSERAKKALQGVQAVLLDVLADWSRTLSNAPKRWGKCLEALKDALIAAAKLANYLQGEGVALVDRQDLTDAINNAWDSFTDCLKGLGIADSRLDSKRTEGTNRIRRDITGKGE